MVDYLRPDTSDNQQTQGIRSLMPYLSNCAVLRSDLRP